MKGPKPRLFEPDPPRDPRGPLTRAAGRTVTAMAGAGQLEAADELTVAGVRLAARLADQCYRDPECSPFTTARALAELGAWHDRLGGLRGAGTDELDDLLRLLSADSGDASEPR